MNIITNIGELCGIVPKGVLRKQGSEMDELVTLKDAFLTVRDGRIAGFGSMKDCPVRNTGAGIHRQDPRIEL